MKIIPLALALCLFAAPATFADPSLEVVMACSGMEAYTIAQQSFAPVATTITIMKDTSAPFGLRAVIASGDQKIDVPNTKVYADSPNKYPGTLGWMASQRAWSFVPWRDVKSLRVGEIGVSNKPDAAPVSRLFELLDKSGEVVARIVTLGVGGMGRCIR